MLQTSLTIGLVVFFVVLIGLYWLKPQLIMEDEEVNRSRLVLIAVIVGLATTVGTFLWNEKTNNSVQMGFNIAY